MSPRTSHSRQPLHALAGSERHLPTHPSTEGKRPEVARVAVADARHTRARLCFTLLGMAAAAVLALMATRAHAQNANFQYDSIEMHNALQDETRVRQLQAQAKQYASSGEGSAAPVNGYFAYYLPAKMTAPDGVKHISELMDEARTLLGRAELAGRTQTVSVLTRYLFEGMRKVVEGNHHPTARISALLLLGDLNSRPANNSAQTAPVPLLQALPILLKEYQNENNVDGVRAAALRGIHRHVRFGFPQIQDAQRTSITNLMTQLLDSEAPEGRPAAAHAYLQRFAVDILDTLRQNEDKSLAVKLVGVSTKPETPDLIALYSAARLGRMAKELQGQVQDPDKVLNSWSRRVLNAFEKELARLEGLDRPTPNVQQPADPKTFLQAATTRQTNQRRSAQSMMGDEGMEGMDDMMEMEMMDDSMEMMEDDMGMEGMMMMPGMMRTAEANPQPPEVRASRKKLNYVLQHLHLGVAGSAKPGKPSQPGGLLASVADDKKPVVEAWITSMEPVITGLNDEMLDDRKKYLEGLQEQIAVLKEMVGDPVDEEAPMDELPEELQPVDPAAPEGTAEEANAMEELGLVGE